MWNELSDSLVGVSMSLVFCFEGLDIRGKDEAKWWFYPEGMDLIAGRSQNYNWTSNVTNCTVLIILPLLF